MLQQRNDPLYIEFLYNKKETYASINNSSLLQPISIN